MGTYVRGGVFVVLVVIIVWGAGGCQMSVVNGSGRVQTESRMVQGFTEVDLSGQGTLTITQGADEALTIEAEDNLLPALTSDVQQGRLVLGTKASTILRASKPIRYDLRVKDLSAIRLSGAGNINATTFRADSLELRTSGSGTIQIDQLAANALTSRISGAGDQLIGGIAPRQDVTISGAGNYRAASLASREANVSVSGTGNVDVRVSDALAVKISGMGRVEYSGSPRVTSDISGLGRINQAAVR